MKNLINPLMLAGQGYLVDLNVTVQPATVQITFFPALMPGSEEQDARSDQVILECTLSPHLAQGLQRINRWCPINQGVSVHFEALYQQIAASYWGQNSEDPLAIVMLKGELIDIKHWRHDSAALQFISAG